MPGEINPVQRDKGIEGSVKREAEMKCDDINMIEYVEGKPSREARLHVETCKRCGAKALKLMNLSHLISNQYAKGKKQEEELDRKLGSIEMAKMKNLPDGVLEKIREMRDKDLISKLKKVIGKGKNDAEGLVESLLSPRMHVMPASPKDITRTNKTRRKKKVK